jgi:hypothetical protein
VGCLEPIGHRRDKVFECTFRQRGFDGLEPCGTWYHSHCIRVGAPFTTRLTRGGKRWSTAPSDLTGAYTFVCELCSVRSVVGRELRGATSDRVLLILERMRMIDTASSLAPTSRYNNGLALRKVLSFRETYGIPSGHRARLLRPPTSDATSVLWAMEHYVLQESSKRDGTITFNTARALRSGASTWARWEAALEDPTAAEIDSPTDSVLTGYCIQGMKRRLGTKSTPSMALRHHHVMYNQTRRGERFYAPHASIMERYNQAAANVVELYAWLGWLRGGETFATDWVDVEVSEPSADGGRYGLPPHTGAVLLTLTPETKSDATITADIVMAWATSGGFQLGHWLTELRALAVELGWGDGPMFRTHAGRRWTSRHFRTEYLWPLLAEQRSRGDPLFMTCDDTPGNTIQDKFWSMHMYRRGATSHVARHRDGCVRKATRDEINEHARWRCRNTGSETVSLHYQEMSIEDRLYITLLCQ